MQADVRVMLDEWRDSEGEPFMYDGKDYQVSGLRLHTATIAALLVTLTLQINISWPTTCTGCFVGQLAVMCLGNKSQHQHEFPT